MIPGVKLEPHRQVGPNSKTEEPKQESGDTASTISTVESTPRIIGESVKDEGVSSSQSTETTSHSVSSMPLHTNSPSNIARPTATMSTVSKDEQMNKNAANQIKPENNNHEDSKKSLKATSDSMHNPNQRAAISVSPPTQSSQSGIAPFDPDKMAAIIDEVVAGTKDESVSSMGYSTHASSTSSINSVVYSSPTYTNPQSMKNSTEGVASGEQLMRTVYSNISYNATSGVYDVRDIMYHQLENYVRNMSTDEDMVKLTSDIRLTSPGLNIPYQAWTEPENRNEFEVVLYKGTSGLCLNVGMKNGFVSVLGFRRTSLGLLGPAEGCGLIRVDDKIVSVDGIRVNSQNEFASVMQRLKSSNPVKIGFRRDSSITSSRTLQSSKQTSSVFQLDNPHDYTLGTAQRGVRCIAHGRWAAEVPSPNGTGIIQIGIFPNEKAAATAYNEYIFRQGGNSAYSQMHPAAVAQKPNAPSRSPSPGYGRSTPPPAGQYNQRGMQSQKTVLTIAQFTPDQKEQLRSQIMVFKYISQSGPIPHNVLSKALRSGEIPSSHEPVKHRARTFRDDSEVKVKRKRRGRKKKKSYDDDTSSDEGFQAPSNTQSTQPSRRSSRNATKKVKKYNDDVDNFGISDEEKTEAKDKEEVVDTGPAMEKILGVQFFSRENEDDEPIMKFLVKWKGQSYLHLSWMSKLDLEVLGRYVAQRVKRYIQNNRNVIHEAKERYESDGKTDDFEYFSPNYLEIDRILAVKEEIKEESSDEEEVPGTKAGSDPEKYQEKGKTNVVIESSGSSVTKPQLQESGNSLNSIMSNPITNTVSVPPVVPPSVQNSSNTIKRDDKKSNKEPKKALKYLIKWRDLSYADCSWEWEDVVTDDRKIAQFHRFNHPPLLNGAHPAMFSDVRPHSSTWAKYQSSPQYNSGNELRSYQLEGLNWMVFSWYNRRNCILADEMGLGKTIQATSMLEHLRQRENIRGPFLVIAPLATLGNWKREIETWTGMNCVVYHDSEGGAESRRFIREHEFFFNESYTRRGIYKFNVIVTSYHIVMSDSEVFESIRWRYIVVDEAHKLKNRDAKLLQVMRMFRWDSCLLMTGTPLQNGVYELWSLLNFIEPEKFPSQQLFYNQFGDLTTADQVAALHEELRPYMLRRVKEDVEKSIPPKEETIIDVELTNMQKKYYRAIFERNRTFLNQGSSSGNVANLVNVEMELRKCCNHPFLIKGVEEKEVRNVPPEERLKKLIQASGKTVLMDKLLMKFKTEGSKVLIFSQFKIMLDILEDLMHAKGYIFERMDGSLRGNARQAAIDRFNDANSKTFAFLLSTRAGGVGINLIAANAVILYDSDWNPQNDLQAVARCHRIGQTQSVKIFRLVTKNTYEAQMFEIASKKLGMHHAVFETGGVRKDFHGDDSKADMMSLMSLDRDKIEMMIRYGAYAIMGEDEDDAENKKINEADIDHILSSSRTIRYDPTTGNAENEKGKDGESAGGGAASALSFSKATFISESADSAIDFNDDKFWEKVLGPKLVQKLMTEVQEGKLKSYSDEKLKEFLGDVRDLARAVVKERQAGGRLEDVDQIMAILIELKVVGPVKPEINVKKVAAEWIQVMERPKRRRNQEDSEMMYHPYLDGAQAVKKKGKRKVSQYYDEFLDEEFGLQPLPKPGKKRGRKKGSKRTKSEIKIRLRRIGESESYEILTVSTTSNSVQNMLNRKRSITPTRKRKTKKADLDSPDASFDENEVDNSSDSDDAFIVKRRGPKSNSSKRKKRPTNVVTSEDDEDEAGSVKKIPEATSTSKTGKAEDEFSCCVCFSSDAYVDDPIVQCDKCTITVHKFCYGIQEIPSDNNPWLCQRCSETEEGMAPDELPSCTLCPMKKLSAFKKTVDDKWAHVVCALWLHGVEFEDIHAMLGIKDTRDDTTNQDSLICEICNEPKGCIQCYKDTCNKAFHPLCGREKSYNMYMDEAGKLLAYCPKHHSEES